MFSLKPVAFLVQHAAILAGRVDSHSTRITQPTEERAEEPAPGLLDPIRLDSRIKICGSRHPRKTFRGHRCPRAMAVQALQTHGPVTPLHLRRVYCKPPPNSTVFPRARPLPRRDGLGGNETPDRIRKIDHDQDPAFSPGHTLLGQGRQVEESHEPACDNQVLLAVNRQRNLVDR